MTLNEDEIFQILRLVDESSIDELYLEIEGLKLTVRKGANKKVNQKLTPACTEPSNSISLEEPTPTESSQRADKRIFVSHVNGVKRYDNRTIVKEDGLMPVKAPLLGIFYRSPEPGAPPFVEVGTYVTEGTTVCVIELMKLFNAVKAGVKGRIAKICVENAQMVEYQQTLFLIEPMEP